MLVLGPDDVRRSLPMDACIDAVRAAMTALGRGEADQPVRLRVRLDDDGILLAKPAAVRGGGVATKLVTVMPHNPERGIPAIQGVVVAFDDDGAASGLLEAGVLTEIRTAAASAVATDLLARPDAGDLAVLGAGVQARSHLVAMAAVRPLRRARVWNRTADRAHALARWAAEEADLGVPVEVVDTPAAATVGADLLCTVTASPGPLVGLGDVAPGVHVNAVGAYRPDTRELAGDLVGAAARLVVDDAAAAGAESGDLLLAVEEGALAADHDRDELGALLVAGERPARAEEDITVFVSLGLAVQDVAAASTALARARRLGLGTEVPL